MLQSSASSLHKKSKRDITDDIPWETTTYGGFGGTTSNSISCVRTPILFVHGSGRDATDWDKHVAMFRDIGYTDDELWRITFDNPSPTHDEMCEQLEHFVSGLFEYTGQDKLSVVAHSLGVTGVRYWMWENDRYESVENFVGLAGANHGMSLCSIAYFLDQSEENEDSTYFLSVWEQIRDTNHPLRQMNEGDETPPPTDYYTISATNDHLFQSDLATPRLEGATNKIMRTTHDGVRLHPDTMAYLREWLQN